MKKTLIIFTLLIPCLLFSQRKAVENVKYSRSSLHVMMIEDPMMQKKDIIVNAFNSMDFPEKYDEHLLKERSANIIGKVDELSKAGIPGFKLRGIEEKIDNYFKQKKTANQLVGKWFNRNATTGIMNMNMIKERGLYNATEDDAADAAMLSQGFAALERTGLDLIGNTFVVLEYFEFIDNEKVAKPIYEETLKAIAEQDLPDMAKKIAAGAAKKLYEKALENQIEVNSALYPSEIKKKIVKIKSQSLLRCRLTLRFDGKINITTNRIFSMGNCRYSSW